MDTTTLKAVEGRHLANLSQKTAGRIVQAPPEPGRFFVLFPRRRCLAGARGHGHRSSVSISREVERAKQVQDGEGYVDALERAYTWFDRQKERQQG